MFFFFFPLPFLFSHFFLVLFSLTHPFRHLLLSPSVYPFQLSILKNQLHGSWEVSTGQHAGLYAADPSDKLSVSGAMEVWQERGAPANKLVLGIGSYGRGWTLASTSNSGVGAPANPASLPSAPGKYTAAAGFLSYYEIENMLRAGGVATFDAERDAMYAVKGAEWVGYDNPDTVKNKCEYALQGGYAGAMVWALDLDRFYGTDTYPLVKAIKDTFAGSDADDVGSGGVVATTTEAADVNGGGGGGAPTTTAKPGTTTDGRPPALSVHVSFARQIPGFSTTVGPAAAQLREMLLQLEDEKIGLRGIALSPAGDAAFVDHLFGLKDSNLPPPPPPPPGRTCAACSGGDARPCKRLSDSACFDYVDASTSTCSAGTRPCAAPEDIFAFTLMLPESISSVQSQLEELLAPLLATLLCQLLAVTKCEDAVEIVLISVDNDVGGDDEDRARRLQKRNRNRKSSSSSTLSTVSFYAFQAGSVIDASTVLSAPLAGDSLAGDDEKPTAVAADGEVVQLVDVTTAAASIYAKSGPVSDFDCQSLASNDCSGMEAACTSWCRGPPQMTCDQHIAAASSFPVNTVVHDCTCAAADSAASARCILQSQSISIQWADRQVHPAYVLKDGDSLSFAFAAAGYTVYKLASGEAYASCDFEGAELLATATNDALTFTETVVHAAGGTGFEYFADRERCASGVKLEIYVKAGPVASSAGDGDGAGAGTGAGAGEDAGPSGLKGGAVAGIVIGMILVAVIVVAAVVNRSAGGNGAGSSGTAVGNGEGGNEPSAVAMGPLGTARTGRQDKQLELEQGESSLSPV